MHHLSAMKERGRSDQHTKELERIVTAAIAAGMKDLANPGIAAKAARCLDAMDVSDLTRHRYRVHLIAVGKTAVKWWPADVLPREPFLALSGQGAQMPAPPVFQPAEACTLVSDKALAMNATGGRLWAFLLMTGARYKEAAWARWDRLDLGRGTFGIIPPDAAEHAAGSRVKRNKSRTTSLQVELVEILKAWPGKHEGFLFPDEWRMRPHVHNVFAFRAHLEALGIPLKDRRTHALRHTHACLAISIRRGLPAAAAQHGPCRRGDAGALRQPGHALAWPVVGMGWGLPATRPGRGEATQQGCRRGRGGVMTSENDLDRLINSTVVVEKLFHWTGRDRGRIAPCLCTGDTCPGGRRGAQGDHRHQAV